MTRTERNQNPAALVKDRHSRSGLHQSSELQRKNGAGAHNWGSFRQEGELELAANADARLETDADAAADDVFDIERDEAMPLPRMNKQPKGNMMNQDGMMMDNQDLAKEVISTSPSESMSSLHSAEGQARGNNVAAQGHPQGQRSTSNISDAEREQARIYREGVMNKGGVDLAHIARTSYGIAQSPPSNNTNGMLSMSPTQAKGGFTKQ